MRDCHTQLRAQALEADLRNPAVPLTSSVILGTLFLMDSCVDDIVNHAKHSRWYLPYTKHIINVWYDEELERLTNFHGWQGKKQEFNPSPV